MTSTRQVRIRTRSLGRERGDPRLVGTHHWALEIVGNDPREPSLLIELSVLGGIYSALKIRPDKEFKDFFTPEEVPDSVRLDFVGSTTLSYDQIAEKAGKIIGEYPYYTLVDANCQAFVIRVAIAIITAPTPGLKGREKKVDDDGLDKAAGLVDLGKKSWDNAWDKVRNIFG